MDGMERHRQTSECHAELLRIARHIDGVLGRMEAAHMTGWVGELSYIPEAIGEASRTIGGNAARDVNDQIRHGETMSKNMVLHAIGIVGARAQ